MYKLFFIIGNFLELKITALLRYIGGQLLPLLYKGRRKMDGLIPNCVKGNMHLPLEIKLISESNCFVCASICLQTYTDFSLGITKAGLSINV